MPKLDGTVQPISDPEANLEDAHLSRALDELAQMADQPAHTFVSMSSPPLEADENEAENQLPQPLLEPIPIEVPLPPTPVVVQAPLNVAPDSPSDMATANHEDAFAELAALSAGMPNPAPTFSNNFAELSVLGRPRTVVTSWLFALIILVIFVMGMLTERFVRVMESLRLPRIPVKEAAKVPLAESELTGRISYKTKEGENRPDRGARILLFPQQRLGEVKLPVTGFRPADSASDQRIADAGLKAIGGGAVTANETGNFRLPIEAGSYHVLVLSHFQSRDDQVTDPTLIKLLAEYFDKPDELLGRLRYQFSPLRIKGTGDVWDQSF